MVHPRQLIGARAGILRAPVFSEAETCGGVSRLTRSTPRARSSRAYIRARYYLATLLDWLSRGARSGLKASAAPPPARRRPAGEAGLRVFGRGGQPPNRKGWTNSWPVIAEDRPHVLLTSAASSVACERLAASAPRRILPYYHGVRAKLSDQRSQLPALAKLQVAPHLSGCPCRESPRGRAIAARTPVWRAS